MASWEDTYAYFREKVATGLLQPWDTNEDGGTPDDRLGRQGTPLDTTRPELAEAVTKAWRSLDVVSQGLLHLAYNERRTQAEIGRALGISQPAVSGRLATITRRLKKELNKAVQKPETPPLFAGGGPVSLESGFTVLSGQRKRKRSRRPTAPVLDELVEAERLVNLVPPEGKRWKGFPEFVGELRKVPASFDEPTVERAFVKDEKGSWPVPRLMADQELQGPDLLGVGARVVEHRVGPDGSDLYLEGEKAGFPSWISDFLGEVRARAPERLDEAYGFVNDVLAKKTERLRAEGKVGPGAKAWVGRAPEGDSWPPPERPEPPAG